MLKKIGDLAALYLRSYLPSDFTISMIYYLLYKDLIKIRVPFTFYSAEQKLLKSFLQYTINESNKPDSETRRINTYVSFGKKLVRFVRSTKNTSISIYDRLTIKLVYSEFIIVT